MTTQLLTRDEQAVAEILVKDPLLSLKILQAIALNAQSPEDPALPARVADAIQRLTSILVHRECVEIAPEIAYAISVPMEPIDTLDVTGPEILDAFILHPRLELTLYDDLRTPGRDPRERERRVFTPNTIVISITEGLTWFLSVIDGHESGTDSRLSAAIDLATFHHAYLGRLEYPDCGILDTIDYLLTGVSPS